MRARELGIRIGRLEPGPLNAITDVPGVRVGHTTLISGDGPLRRGEGPVRTGVTVIVPHDGDVWTEPVFAGAHRLNGNGPAWSGSARPACWRERSASRTRTRSASCMTR